MELQVGVKVLLRNKEGKFLMVRRSPKKYPEVGPKWDIVGGSIEPGSSLMENLKREIREEVSLEMAGTPVLVAAQDILRVSGKHIVRLTYTGIIDGSPKIDEDHSEWKWFTLDELKALSEQDLDGYFKELLDKGVFG